MTTIQGLSTKKKSSILLSFSGGLAITAGLILILSGYISHPLLLAILDLLTARFGLYFPATMLEALKLSTSILSFLTGLGGIFVVTGGLFLLLRHKLIGRILIGLGGGMGILGLAISLGEAYYFNGFSSEGFFTIYWAGLLLASTSIIISRKA